MILLKWLVWIYKDIQEFYTFYMLFLTCSVGLFCLLVDCKRLKEKKLKKEAKICKWIGWSYLIGGIGLYVVFKIG